MKRVVLLMGVLPLASCGLMRFLGISSYESYPENPFKDIQTVVVLPFINETGTEFDIDEFGNICASELVKFPGFRVYRPFHVHKALGTTGSVTTAEDALRAGKALKADAVLVVAVTDYNPYDPPKIAVTVQFMRTVPRRLSAAEIDAMSQSATWHRLPLRMTRESMGNFVAAFDAVYDGHSRSLQSEMDDYLVAHRRDRLGFKDTREILMVQPRFIQFVSCQFLNLLLDMDGA